MSARVLTVTRPPAPAGAGDVSAGGVLSARFAAAATGEPLSGLSAGQRGELAAVLDRAAAFEDLPGKWQAALLQAEGGHAAAAGCCH